MITTLNLPGSGTTAEDNGIRIYGSEIRGPARMVAIVFWAGIFLLCLLVFGLSLDKIDRDSRMTCADQARTYSDMNHQYLIEICEPFEDAIFELGLTHTIFARYFTVLRVLAGAPFFILSILIVRKRSDRWVAVLFAILMAVLGAAGTWLNPLWLAFPYPRLALPIQLLGTILFSGFLIFYAFPDGRFLPRWTRWLAPLAIPLGFFSIFSSETALNYRNWPEPLNLLPVLALGIGGLLALIHRYRQPISPARPLRFGWFVAGAFLISLNFFADFGVWNVYPTLTGQSLINAGMPAVIWELVQDSSWYLAQFLFAVCIAVSVFPGRVREAVPSYAGH